LSYNINSSLAIEINKIAETTNHKTDTIEYTMTLHTPVLDIKLPICSSIDTMRNYTTNVSDEMIAVFFMWAGDFLKDVLPYRDILELTIRTYDRITLKYESTRYRLILLNNENNQYGSYNSKESKETLNKFGQFTISGQCLLREVEALRTKHVSGVFRSTTVKDVITSEYAEGMKDLAIEGKKIALGIDVVEPNNDAEYNHITVPTGVMLLDLPSFLQNTIYGIYNGGIGTYVQKYNNKTTAFIFPAFDPERFEKTTKRLMIFRSDSVKYGYIENTFKVEGDLVKLIAGKEIEHLDDGGTALIDTGDSIAAGNPSLLTKRNVDVSGSKGVVSSENQLSGSAISNRRDGANNTVYLGNESNLYKHRSQMVMKKGSVIKITWYYADPEIIYPGMPTCIKYADSRLGIVKLYGTVQGIFYSYNFAKKTLSAILFIMVTKPIDQEKTA